MLLSNWKHFVTNYFWAREPKNCKDAYYNGAIEVTVWDGQVDGIRLSASGLVLTDLPDACFDWDIRVIAAVKLTETQTAADLIKSANSLKI